MTLPCEAHASIADAVTCEVFVQRSQFEVDMTDRDALIRGKHERRTRVRRSRYSIAKSRSILWLLLTLNGQVSCQEHRYVWAACGAAETGAPCPLQGVVKVDVVEGTSEKWLPETHEFMGEVRNDLRDRSVHRIIAEYI